MVARCRGFSILKRFGYYLPRYPKKIPDNEFCFYIIYFCKKPIEFIFFYGYIVHMAITSTDSFISALLLKVAGMIYNYNV